MKIAVFIISVFTASITSCAQDIPASKVPSVVQNTIQSRFTNAVNIEWEKKNNFYEAEFKMNNVEHTAHINAAGKLLVYKTDITVNELPAVIKDALAKTYPGYTIDEAEKLEKDGITYYQAELEGKSKKDIQVVYTVTSTAAQGINYMK